MVPKSAREVALADFSFTVAALPVLTQVVHNVPFLNIIQTTVWGVGLGMRGIRAARESKKRNYAPNLS